MLRNKEEPIMFFFKEN